MDYSFERKTQIEAREFEKYRRKQKRDEIYLESLDAFEFTLKEHPRGFREIH